MSLAERQLESEWLDELPANAPEAIHSRGDLRRVNTLMGNARWLARTVEELKLGAPETLVELACGDGVQLLRLLERNQWRPSRILMLDQQPVVTEQTLERLRRHSDDVEVITADVFDWLSSDATPHCDLITTNLFLHHFSNERLGTLLQLIAAKTDAFIACEPRRSAFALFNTRLLGLIGCNGVTRHDAFVSVQAGFLGDELSRLWPKGWQTTERQRGLFSHCLGTKRIFKQGDAA